MFQRLKARGLHWGALCGVVAALVAHLLSPLLNPLELQLLDLRYRMQSKESLSPQIAMIELSDDPQLRRLSPYPRDVLASLIRQSHRAGARAIVLDVLLDRMRPAAEASEDEELLDAIATAGNVVLPVILSDEGAFVEPHPFYRAAAAGIGHVYADESPSDRVVRSFRPVMLPPDAPQPIPSLPWIANRVAESETGSAIPNLRNYTEVERAIRQPLNRNGQLRIRFVPPARLPRWMSAQRVSKERFPLDSLRHRIVFIGASAPSLGDRHRDPFTATFPESDPRSLGTPGVLIQAQALSTLLSPQALRDASRAQQITALFITSILLSMVLFALPLVLALPVALAFSFFAIIAGHRLFSEGSLVVEETPFVAASLLCAISTVVLRYFFLERDRRRAVRVFSRYLHPRVVRELVATEGSETLSRSQRRKVTILFSDIRNYTRATANMAPEEIVALLNEYFTLVSKEVLEREGFIDKYIGDGMMALFGMFANDDDGAIQAVRSAAAMRHSLAKHRENGGGLQFNIGIGIHTGTVVAGDMGSPEHRDYTVIGSDVNLASRVESMTKELKADILITEETYRLVQARVKAIDRGEHEIRGFEDRKFRLYELVEAPEEAAVEGNQQKK